MPASSHTIAGTVMAIQYTGSNAAEIATIMGSGWSVYTNSTTSVIALCGVGGEMFLNALLVHANDWMVSLPTYGTDTPTLLNGFNILTNSQFVQQYSA